MFLLSLLSWVPPISILTHNVNGLPVADSEICDPSVVDLGYSKYRGTTLSSGVNQYIGMRYASPPVGPLRFRGPKAPLVTTGVQNATAVSWRISR